MESPVRPEHPWRQHSYNTLMHCLNPRFALGRQLGGRVLGIQPEHTWATKDTVATLIAIKDLLPRDALDISDALRRMESLSDPTWTAHQALEAILLALQTGTLPEPFFSLISI